MNWIQFKIRFNDPTRFWIDIFLIDTAIRHAIEKRKPDLWRFHRRAAKDSIGHQLSLLCYISKQELVHVQYELINHKAIQILEREDIIKSRSVEIMKPGIEKTSDIHWSEPLQRSWPYFAHGSCQMIMGLLENDFNFQKKKFSEVEEYYTNLSDGLEDMFTSIGSHAFIHHLSALFGYAPLKLRI